MSFERTIAPKGTRVFKLLAYPLLWIFSTLPFYAINGLSNGIYFIVYKLLKYRIKVVRTNLENAFPNRSESERLIIEKAFYKHLSDLFLETIKLITVSRSEINKRVINVHQGLYDDYNAKNQSVMVVMSHCGNWEWICVASSAQCQQQIQCVYKSLSSPGWDWLMYKLRSKFGTNPFTMEQTLRAMAKNRDITTINAFVGDQNPSSGATAYWTTFLNQETAFLQGPEKISKRFNLPVVYLATTKTKRGHYAFTSKVLTEDPNSLHEGELTEMIVRETEAEILNQPEIWLWSHRRWKHKKDIHS